MSFARIGSIGTRVRTTEIRLLAQTGEIAVSGLRRNLANALTLSPEALGSPALRDAVTSYRTMLDELAPTLARDFPAPSKVTALGPSRIVSRMLETSDLVDSSLIIGRGATGERFAVPNSASGAWPLQYAHHQLIDAVERLGPPRAWSESTPFRDLPITSGRHVQQLFGYGVPR